MSNVNIRPLITADVGCEPGRSSDYLFRVRGVQPCIVIFRSFSRWIMAVGRCHRLPMRCGDCGCVDVDPESAALEGEQDVQSCPSAASMSSCLREVVACFRAVGFYLLLKRACHFRISHCTPLLIIINEVLRVVRRYSRFNRRMCVPSVRLAPHWRCLEMLWLCYMRTLA